MKKHKGQLRLKKCILVLVIAVLLANFYGLPGGAVFAAGEVTRLLCAEELD